MTKESVAKLLVERYSRPGYKLHPSPPDFSGLTDAYAMGPVDAGIDEKNLKDSENYTYRIGSIGQIEVPGGVVNITETDHDVYPGTIRRVIVEDNGHLFVFTQGTGVNRFRNIPVDPATRIFPVDAAASAVREARRIGGAAGNDTFGPMAFRQLDSELFKDVERLRSGEPLPPVDSRRNPVDPVPDLPRAIFYNDPKRGKDPLQ